MLGIHTVAVSIKSVILYGMVRKPMLRDFQGIIDGMYIDHRRESRVFSHFLEHLEEKEGVNFSTVVEITYAELLEALPRQVQVVT